MTDPTAPAPLPRKSNAPVIIRIILAILFLLPGACGGFFLGAIGVEWANYGMRFAGEGGAYALIFVVLGGGSILASVILIGILLRFARWRSAPTASLVLAIVALLTVLLSHGITASTFDEGDTESRLITLLISGLALIVSALPPLLHWWKSNAPPPETKP